VRGERGGALSRTGRVAQDRLTVARGLGVVRETREVRGAERRVGERGDRGAVEIAPAGRRDVLLEGQPGQLVAETDSLPLGRQHPGVQALVQMVGRVAGEPLE
jgi:hypothetical protein